MSYRAIIHDLTTGLFLLRCHVEADDLHEAENAAIAKAVLTIRGHPCDMDVRHLHECAERSLVHAAETQLPLNNGQ